MCPRWADVLNAGLCPALIQPVCPVFPPLFHSWLCLGLLLLLSLPTRVLPFSSTPLLLPLPPSCSHLSLSTGWLNSGILAPAALLGPRWASANLTCPAAVDLWLDLIPGREGLCLPKRTCIMLSVPLQGAAQLLTGVIKGVHFQRAHDFRYKCTESFTNSNWWGKKPELRH